MPFVKDVVSLLFVALIWLLGAFFVYYFGTLMLHLVPAEPAVFVYANVLWISPVCFAGIVFRRVRRKIKGMTEFDRRAKAKEIILQHVKQFVAATSALFLLGYALTLIWPTRC